MSADLLAEFGPPATANKQSTTQLDRDAADKADPWGDFQTSGAPTGSSINLKHDALVEATTPSTSTLPERPISKQPRATAHLPNSSFDLLAGRIREDGQHGGRPPPETLAEFRAPEFQEPMTRDEPADGDVEILFDAAQVEVDDFGDFESAAVNSPTDAKPSRVPHKFDLLDLDGPSLVPEAPYPTAPKSPSFQQRNPFGDLSVATKQAVEIQKVPQHKSTKSLTPVTAWPSFMSPSSESHQDLPKTQGPEWFDSMIPAKAVAPVDDMGPWTGDDDWESSTVPSSVPLKMPPLEAGRHTSQQEARGSNPPDVVPRGATTGSQIPAVSAVPPTNVPPPSLLLSLFPPLFHKMDAELSSSSTNSPDANPLEALEEHLTLATVAARIISGRKLRWKRDMLLSQSTKIGQAGRAGGMKLTGVDRSETVKEDREVSDVVQSYREHVGRLRATVARATSAKGGKAVGVGQVPELAEALPVRTASQAEGGVSAPRQCALCGLKRDERVLKVDGAVEDSFGEWWTEYWGHRACEGFWNRYKDLLPQR